MNSQFTQSQSLYNRDDLINMLIDKAEPVNIVNAAYSSREEIRKKETHGDSEFQLLITIKAALLYSKHFEIFRKNNKVSVSNGKVWTTNQVVADPENLDLDTLSDLLTRKEVSKEDAVTIGKELIRRLTEKKASKGKKKNCPIAENYLEAMNG